MGFDSSAGFHGVKKADITKLRNPRGYQWTDYYDLDAWVREEHEELARVGQKVVLTQAVLKQLKGLIKDGGFGDNPEIDAEYRAQTLEFVSDGLLAISLGGKVLYWSDDSDGQSGSDDTGIVDGALDDTIDKAALGLKAAGQQLTPVAIMAVLEKQKVFCSSTQVVAALTRKGWGKKASQSKPAKKSSKKRT